MSYLHCHNTKCHWSQDDFWDFSFRWSSYKHRPVWRYNPISCFLEDIFSWKWGYWRPRRVHFDEYEADDRGWKRSDPTSWYLIWYEFKRMINKFRKQKYWTYKSWRQAVKRNGGKWPVCPKCGLAMLDID